MPQTLAGVVYERNILAPRRVILPHDDSHLSDGRHRLLKSEVMVVVPLSLVAGMSATEAAIFAITRATGRAPPSMERVHAFDSFSSIISDGSRAA